MAARGSERTYSETIKAIVEAPFIGRHLSVGVHIPLAGQQDEHRIGTAPLDVHQVLEHLAVQLLTRLSARMAANR